MEHSNQNQTWYSGLDAGRIVAAFGVIAIHAGIVSDNKLTDNAHIFQNFFNFVVPFFITASLFLSSRSINIKWKEWIYKTIKRLIIPYLIWGTIYIILRLARYIHTPGIALADPWSLIFLNGGGSIALYFIPLLITGMAVAKTTNPIAEKFSPLLLTFFTILSYICLGYLIKTHNNYDLGTGQAFSKLIPHQENDALRIILAFIGHAIYCLPHVFFSLIAKNLKNEKTVLLSSGLILFILPILISCDVKWIDIIFSHIKGDGFLFLCLGFSSKKYRPIVRYSSIINRLAVYTFGIYLSHQSVLQIFQIISRKIFHQNYYINTPLIILQTLAVLLLISCFIHFTTKIIPQLSLIFAIR